MLYDINLIMDLLSKALFFLGYFSNFKRLKEPLCPQAEKEMFLRMAKGDKEAKEILINHNLRLVVHVAKKYQNSPIEMEDLISIGTIGLIKSINSFDMGKNTKFATYGAKCIDNEILMALRSHMRSATNVYLEDIVMAGDDGSKISLLQMLPQNEDKKDEFGEFENTITAKSILALVDKVLTPNEKQVILARYTPVKGEVMTQAQIAKKMGISRSYVSRIEKRAIEKLSREALK